MRKLRLLKCPREYMLDIDCTNNCPISQMNLCWEDTFKKYSFVVSEEAIYKHELDNIYFEFKRKY